MADRKAGRQVIVAGVSVRPIVQSAVRAGFLPYAIDRFGDVDTRAAAQDWRPLPTRISRLSMARCLAQVPEAPVVWGSPFENYPGVIEAMGGRREVWGASPQAVRLVRSPRWLASSLAAEGIRFPTVWEQPPRQGRTKRLIVKRRKSGGGLGVHLPDAERLRRGTGGRGVYYQEFIPGRPVSGLFWSDGDTVRLLAVAEQLVGASEFGAGGFLFCGSILPVSIDPRAEENLQRAGTVVARGASLRGVFGVDAIVRGAELYVLEVNPRWTASVQLFELASGVNAFELHVRAFAPGTRVGRPDGLVGRVRSTQVWGRAILYARRPTVFYWRPVLPGAENRTDNSGWLADVPQDGTRIRPGEPVLSVVCSGPTVEAVREQLVHLAGRVYRQLLE